MSRQYPRLSIPRCPEPPQQFPAGTLVMLKSCPGPTGIVQKMRRGMVHVLWSDLHFTGHHKASALIFAPTQECPAEGPHLTQDESQAAG